MTSTTLSVVSRSPSRTLRGLMLELGLPTLPRSLLRRLAATAAMQIVAGSALQLTAEKKQEMETSRVVTPAAQDEKEVKEESDCDCGSCGCCPTEPSGSGDAAEPSATEKQESATEKQESQPEAGLATTASGVLSRKVLKIAEETAGLRTLAYVTNKMGGPPCEAGGITSGVGEASTDTDKKNRGGGSAFNSTCLANWWSDFLQDGISVGSKEVNVIRARAESKQLKFELILHKKVLGRGATGTVFSVKSVVNPRAAPQTGAAGEGGSIRSNFLSNQDRIDQLKFPMVLKLLDCDTPDCIEDMDWLSDEILITAMLTKAAPECVARLVHILILPKSARDGNGQIGLVLERLHMHDPGYESKKSEDADFHGKVLDSSSEVLRRAFSCQRKIADLGILHNDLKPDNIGWEVDNRLVPDFSAPKWFDFGLATWVPVKDWRPVAPVAGGFAVVDFPDVDLMGSRANAYSAGHKAAGKSPVRHAKVTIDREHKAGNSTEPLSSFVLPTDSGNMELFSLAITMGIFVVDGAWKLDDNLGWRIWDGTEQFVEMIRQRKITYKHVADEKREVEGEAEQRPPLRLAVCAGTKQKCGAIYRNPRWEGGENGMGIAKAFQPKVSRKVRRTARRKGWSAQLKQAMEGLLLDPVAYAGDPDIAGMLVRKHLKVLEERLGPAPEI